MTFPHEATLERTVKTGTKYVYGDNGSTPCFLQPMDDEKSQLFGIAFSKGFHCYTPLESDVLEGDRVSIAGTKYGVKGVKEFNYGSMPHKRVLLEQL